MLFRSLFCTALVLGSLALPAAAQNVFVQPVSHEVITERLELASKKNSERKNILMRLFSEAGCTNATEQPVKGSRVGNVVCSLTGRSNATILVGAHFDKVGSLGVIDNWSGASMLPSLYQSLIGRERNHTFVFVGFTDEELGFRGSEQYVKQLGRDQRSLMRAMVNIDCVGMTGTKVWVQRADKRLLGALSQVASSLKIPLEGVNIGNVGDTDSISFASRGIPVIDIHSITQRNFERLHEGRDTVKSIQPDDYYDTYKLLSVYLGFLDISLD